MILAEINTAWWLIPVFVVLGLVVILFIAIGVISFVMERRDRKLH